MNYEIMSSSESVTENTGALLGALLLERGEPCFLALDGDMGAGKTTFIAEICRQLGAQDDFGSPTFSLVNEYLDRDGNPIYHFDLYRIDTPREVADMGAEEYFNSGDLCLVEWPEILGPLEPDDVRKVSIRVNPDLSRTLEF